MRLWLHLAATIVIASNCYASDGIAAKSLSQGAYSESGPLLLEPSVKEGISSQACEHAGAYKKFETQLMTNISKGPQLMSIILDFDYDIAGSHGEEVLNQTYKLLNNPQDMYENVKEKIPQWSLPIYEYTEGIPTGRLSKVKAPEFQPYEVINSELRDAEPDSPSTIEWVSRMRFALSHLPKYEGISFRGARLNLDRVEKYYPVGGLAQDKAFVSTSVSPEIALRFAQPVYNLVASAYDKINVLFVIKGFTGRAVSAFAEDHNDEDEILFANGTTFKVIAKSGLFKLPEVLGRNQIIILQEELN